MILLHSDFERVWSIIFDFFTDDHPAAPAASAPALAEILPGRMRSLTDAT